MPCGDCAGGVGELLDWSADPLRQKPRQQHRRDNGRCRGGEEGDPDGRLECLQRVLLHDRGVLAGHRQVVKEQARRDQRDGYDQGDASHEEDHVSWATNNRVASPIGRFTG